MVVVGKKAVILSGLVVVILVLGIVGFFSSSKTVFGDKKVPVVIVDAGHGEPDGGAVGANGTLEKDINLDIARKLQEVLEGKGIKVIMTRTGDFGLFQNNDASIREKKREDMNTRLSIMKKSGADIFISIHMNSFSSSKTSGLHVFYAKNHEEVKSLAENIQDRISKITGAKTHTVKTADKNLFLMKNPPLPAILVECGFISNPEEEKKLNDADYRSRIAWAIAEAVEKYFE